MSEVKEDDFVLFDSVVYVNVVENYLFFGMLCVVLYVYVSNYISTVIE